MTIQSLPDVVWEPDERYIRRSRILRLMRRHGIENYGDFYARSIEDPAWFWDTVVRDELALQWFQPYRQVLDLSDGSAWPHWFVGGKLNYVVNAVDRHAAGARAGVTAIRYEGEDGATRTLTYRELQVEVNRLANGLRALGIGRGDRVGIFMPMVPETAIAVLACSRLGAVIIPTFSGYGAEAVAARLRDGEAKVLLTVDAGSRRARPIPMKGTADAAADLAPTVERVVVLRRSAIEIPWNAGRDLSWDDCLAGQPETCPAEETGADDPCMIIYTSGTTGRPKGALHVHAGFPLKAAQDLAHCFDLQENDTLFWLTDLGWMMGPWAIMGALILGATLVLYDGTPDYPRPDRLWDLVERHRITVLGISPTVIRALMAHGEEWVRKHDLSSLRVLGSSGEAWSESAWAWFFEHVGRRRCPIINYSGGTEVSGGILGCNTILPLRPTAFSAPVPGMAADVVDDRGSSVRGQVGELVVRQPWVGMTHGFWRDRERYLDTYWSRFPGVWTHGDWAEVAPDGSWYIRGRSDDTLKVAGKRVGPAEVESACAGVPAVLEAAAVGVPDAVKGESIVAFVVLRAGHDASEEVRDAIRQEVGRQLGKALLPKTVLFTDELPKTRNGKIIRRLIRARYLELETLGDLSSLENPSGLDAIGRAR